MPDQQQYQLKLSRAETDRLAARVATDYRSALSDNDRRIRRWKEYYRRWRGLVDLPAAGDEDKSNFPVPVIRWNVSQKWAQNTDSIFGDDAEIVAIPTGPSDYKNDKKIGRYMTWRVFNNMQLTNRLCTFELYKIIFGRVIAYSPWTRKSFTYQDSKGTQEKVFYKGPDFIVLEPDDFIAPAEQVETLHDFSWIARKYRASPNDLLQGEDDGRYQNIKKNFKKFLSAAYKRSPREGEGDEIKEQKDDAEGVNMGGGLSNGSTLRVIAWYGKWRMLKSQSVDADEWDVKNRSLYESDIVVHYIEDLNMIIGVQDLRQLYPASPKPRPFVEASYQKDGSYWCDGMAQQLIDIEDEIRVNHNLGADAQQLTVSPVIFFRPASGFDTKKFVYKPGALIPTDAPEKDVRVIEIAFNGEAVAQREQMVLAYAERVTGNSDMSMGRQSDRPNAPKTARGTMAILEQGNLRMTLDTTILREDFSKILQHFWILEWMFSDEETFFRVTEEDANGLFPVQNGGSLLLQSDRDGDYDFRLKLATSKWSREAEKERTLARYQLDLQNPLIAQNPLALWRVTRDAHEALGDPNFAETVPEPPHPDIPINPQQEWSMMQQGETVHVNPMDNDQLHMIRHMRDLQMALQNGFTDQDVIHAMQAHYIDHAHQLEQKQIVAAITQHALEQASAMGRGGVPQPGGPQPAPGGPPQMPAPAPGGPHRLPPHAPPGPKAPGVQEEQSQQEQPAA